MTLIEFLDWLDGRGMIITDDELMEEELNFLGYSLESKITIQPKAELDEQNIILDKP